MTPDLMVTLLPTKAPIQIAAPWLQRWLSTPPPGVVGFEIPRRASPGHPMIQVNLFDPSVLHLAPVLRHTARLAGLDVVERATPHFASEAERNGCWPKLIVQRAPPAFEMTDPPLVAATTCTACGVRRFERVGTELSLVRRGELGIELGVVDFGTPDRGGMTVVSAEGWKRAGRAEGLDSWPVFVGGTRDRSLVALTATYRARPPSSPPYGWSEWCEQCQRGTARYAVIDALAEPGRPAWSWHPRHGPGLLLAGQGAQAWIEAVLHPSTTSFPDFFPCAWEDAIGTDGYLPPEARGEREPREDERRWFEGTQ
jgi:hypothetical protein